MPRKHDPPASDPTDDAPEDQVTETPAHLLQNWVKEMTKDAKAGHRDDSGNSGDDGDDSDSEWSDDDDDEGQMVPTVSITYVVGIPSPSMIEAEDDDDANGDDEDEEGEVEDEDSDEMTQDDMIEMAAILADAINEAMVEESAKAGKPGKKRQSKRGKDVKKVEMGPPSPHSPPRQQPQGRRNAIIPPLPFLLPPPPAPLASKKPPAKGKQAAAAAAAATSKGDSKGSGKPTLEEYEQMLSMLHKRVDQRGSEAEMEQQLLKEFDTAIDGMKKAKAKEEAAARKKAEKPIREKNFRKFRQLMKAQITRKRPSEYFKGQKVEEQRELLDRLQGLTEKEADKPYIMRILESKATPEAKAQAMRKLVLMEGPMSEETQKLHTWIDTFTRIPFGIHKELPVRLGTTSPSEMAAFMADARQQLDRVAYGLEEAKTKLIEVLGQWVCNPTSSGCAIALKGPMGTGKTTLIKDGLSKIIQRPFEFIALGGSSDGAMLEGHSFTYIGSTWGEVVSILLRAGCMNPVIYFDELDKISDSPKGQELAGILTHLTDVAQNDTFKDRYFAGVPLDLSRAVFVFSYNDESKINPILLNRMFKIEVKGYDAQEKARIALDYMLPGLLKEYSFTPEDVQFDESAIGYITQVVSGSEKGVRDMKRGLTTCLAKLNLLRLGMPLEHVFGKNSRVCKRKKKDDGAGGTAGAGRDGAGGDGDREGAAAVDNGFTFPVVVDRDLAAMLAKPEEQQHMTIYS